MNALGMRQWVRRIPIDPGKSQPRNCVPDSHRDEERKANARWHEGVQRPAVTSRHNLFRTTSTRARLAFRNGRGSQENAINGT